METKTPTRAIPLGSWDTHGPVEPGPIDGFMPWPFRSNEAILLRDQRMVHAFNYLGEQSILQLRRIELFRDVTRFIIYAIDGARSSLSSSRSMEKMQVQRALTMVLLNMNVDAWIFHNEREPTPPNYTPTTLFQEDRIKRLLDVFQDMPSPRAHGDPFLRADVRQPSRSVRRILNRAIQNDAPSGMRTKLFQYQKNSLWKLLRRELCPDFIAGPFYVPVKDLEGKTYYIHLTKDAPIISRIPAERWEDAPGGIMCDNMGVGKSCMCIALIMQTLHQFSKIPPTATQQYCELSPGAPASAILVKDGPASIGGDAPRGKSHTVIAPSIEIPSLRDLAAAAVKMNGIEYRRAWEHLGTIMELLDDMSVYYHYHEQEPTGRNRRSRTKRFYPDRSSEVYLSSSTLLIVPPNLMDQWCHEVNKHTEDHALKLLRIDADPTKDIPDHRTLMKYDMVLIPQTRFAREYQAGTYANRIPEKQNCQCESLYISCRCPQLCTISPLMQVRWKRVIVDEGHKMSSKMSDSALLAERLHADFRWLCTGTPTPHLTDLVPQSTSGSYALASDKGDLDRFATLMTSFLHLQPYYDDKTLFSKVLIKALKDHHGLSTGTCSGDWSLESSSSVSRLRYIMDRIMVRNRPEDVAQDVVLPPLYERTVGLDLDYFQAITVNCQIALLQTNVVLSEREGQDYFFHPSQRKPLSDLVDNLNAACFWYPGGNEFQVRLQSARKHSKKALTRHQAANLTKYSQADANLLHEICGHISRALADNDWCTVQTVQEVGYYTRGLAGVLRTDHALLPSLGSNNGAGSDQGHSEDTESERNICLLLAKQVKALREHVAEFKERQEPGSDPQQMPMPHASPGDLATPIDLDAPLASMSAVQDATLTRTERYREATSRERLAQAKILGSTSTKLNYIISQILRHQHSEKSIVFCQDTNAIHYISEYLSLAKVRCLEYYGRGMTEKQRSTNIMTFNTSENVSVIVIDTKHAAFGIDLSSASRVYFVSPIWQAATMRQAIKRAHRLGQTRPVYVETLIINGSFEEEIMIRRSEIDSQERSTPPSTPSASFSSSSSSSTHPSSPAVATTSIEVTASKKGANGMLDDGKMFDYFSRIEFMPVPPKPDASNLEQMTLNSYWGTVRPTYRRAEDAEAFELDDAKSRLENKMLEIDAVPLSREAVQVALRMNEEDVFTMDLDDDDENNDDDEDDVRDVYPTQEMWAVKGEGSGSNTSNRLDGASGSKNKQVGQDLGMDIDEEWTFIAPPQVTNERTFTTPVQVADKRTFFVPNQVAEESLEERYLRTMKELKKSEEARLAAERNAQEANARMLQMQEILQRQTPEKRVLSPSGSTVRPSLSLPRRLSALKLETQEEETKPARTVKFEGGSNSLWVDRAAARADRVPKLEGLEEVRRIKISLGPEMEMSLEPPIKPEQEYYILLDNDDDADSKDGIHLVPDRSEPKAVILVDDDDDEGEEEVKEEKKDNVARTAFYRDARIVPKAEEEKDLKPFATGSMIKVESDSSISILKRSSSAGKQESPELPHRSGSGGPSSSKKVRFA